MVFVYYKLFLKYFLTVGNQKLYLFVPVTERKEGYVLFSKTENPLLPLQYPVRDILYALQTR